MIKTDFESFFAVRNYEGINYYGEFKYIVVDGVASLYAGRGIPAPSHELFSYVFPSFLI
jgi:hypothetical protein